MGRKRERVLTAPTMFSQMAEITYEFHIVQIDIPTL
jgi:hypothetical protein